MKKVSGFLVTTIAMMSAMALTSFAGSWVKNEDNGKWYYLNDDGAYVSPGWNWIDGNNDGVAFYYYFGADGGLLTSGVTPDGYTVSSNGFMVDGAGNAVTQVLTAEGYTAYGNLTSDGITEDRTYELITGDYETSSDPSMNLSTYEDFVKMVDYINILRAKNDLNKLVMDDTLMKAAAIRAEEASRKFSHTRPNGKDCFTALDELGYPKDAHAGEDLAQGQKSALQVINAFYHSNGQRHNMLSREDINIGIGVYESNGEKTWALINGA